MALTAEVTVNVGMNTGALQTGVRSAEGLMRGLGQTLLQGVGLGAGLGAAQLGAKLGQSLLDGLIDTISEERWSAQMANRLGGIDAARSIRKAAESWQFEMPFNEDQISNAVAMLRKFGAEGVFSLTEIADAAAANGLSIDQFAEAVGRLAGGNMRALMQVSTSLGMTAADWRKYGVEIDETTGRVEKGFANLDTVIAAVREKMAESAGTAKRMADADPLAAWNKSAEILKERLGEIFLPMFQLPGQFRERGTIFSDATAELKGMVESYGEGAVGGLRRMAAQGSAAAQRQLADMRAQQEALRIQLAREEEEKSRRDVGALPPEEHMKELKAAAQESEAADKMRQEAKERHERELQGRRESAERAFQRTIKTMEDETARTREERGHREAVRRAEDRKAELQKQADELDQDWFDRLSAHERRLEELKEFKPEQVGGPLEMWFKIQMGAASKEDRVAKALEEEKERFAKESERADRRKADLVKAIQEAGDRIAEAKQDAFWGPG